MSDKEVNDVSNKETSNTYLDNEESNETIVSYNDMLANKNYLLMRCCENGDILGVIKLLDDGADVNCTDGRDTPLYICAAEHYNIVKVLLDYGANINSKNSRGDTALYRACYMRNFSIVKLLLKRGADTEIKNNSGVYPIQMACDEETISIVKLLLEFKASTEVKNKNGETLLYHVNMDSSISPITEILLKHGANVEVLCNNGYSPLIAFIEQDLLYGIKMLLDYGADPNRIGENGNRPIHIAIPQSSLYCVKLLVKYGADINAVNFNGDTTLHVACFNNCLDSAIFLLKHGVDPHTVNNEGLNPVEICDGANEVVKYLIVNYGVSYENAKFDIPSDIVLEKHNINRAKRVSVV